MEPLNLAEKTAEKLVKVIALCAINYRGADYNEGDEFEVTPFYAELWVGNQAVKIAEE